MLDAYLHGTHVVLLCYDITDPKSFEDCDDWLERVRQACSRDRATSAAASAVGSDVTAASPGDPHIHLVGNKIDLLHTRRVTDKQHDAFVSRESLQGGFYVSARNGDQVLRNVYDVAGRSIGVKLSEGELEFHDKVVVASVAAKGGEDDAGKRPQSAAERRIVEEDEASAARLREALRSGLEPRNQGGNGPCCIIA